MVGSCVGFPLCDLLDASVSRNQQQVVAKSQVADLDGSYLIYAAAYLSYIAIIHI
jgi:hypothetical protein